jgi:hypothetical protein
VGKRALHCFGLAAAIALLGGPALAGESTTVAVEIAPPPPDGPADADSLRSVAEAEVASFVPVRRSVIIAVALSQTESETSETSETIVSTASASVRDARTGALLVILEADSRAVGVASPQQRRSMAYAVVGRAVRGVPSALDAK